MPLATAAAPSPKKARLDSPLRVFLYFDGASKGNPGEGGGGWIANTEERTLAFGWNYRDRCTNNEAEYLGMIACLRFAVDRMAGPTTRFTITGDSQMVIRQILGEYKCRAANLVPYWTEAKALYSQLAEMHPVSLEWTRRENNVLADLLSNIAIEQRGDRVVTLAEDDDPVVVDKAYLVQQFY